MNSVIEDVMTRFPHSIGIDQPLKVAKNMLSHYGIRHLPVKSGGELVGIVSERDIDLGLSWEKTLPTPFTIADIALPDPYCIPPQTPISKVTETLSKDKIGCALIVENNELVGIFTTVDACRLLTDKLTHKCCKKGHCRD